MARSSNTGRKYVNRWLNRHGKAQYRFRRNGYQCPMPAPDTTEFNARYAAALLDSESVRTDMPRNVATHSLEWTARLLQTAPAWNSHTPGTIKSKTRLIDRMVEPWGDVDMMTVTKSDIMDRLNGIKSPSVRNRIRGLWVEMLDIMEDRSLRSDNPAKRIRRADEKTENTKPWTAAEIAAYEATHAPGTKARLAYELFRSTAQASVDIAKMNRTMVDSQFIRGDRQKTGASYEAPITPRLAAEMARHPASIMFLLTEYGEPFTTDGFNNYINDQCIASRIAARSHGLRVLACVELAESGCTAKEIMSISGHKTLAECERYVQMANNRKLAKSANNKRLLAHPEKTIGAPCEN